VNVTATLKEATEKLDRLKQNLDVAGLFDMASKRYRAALNAQAKSIVTSMKPKDVSKLLGITKAQALKLDAKQLVTKLMRLPAFRKLYVDAPHTFVRADVETRDRANVLSLQNGVKCRRRFVREDGQWHVDQGARCEQAKLTQKDEKLFIRLIGFTRKLIAAAKKHAPNCRKISAAWNKLIGGNKALVAERKKLLRSPARYKLFSAIHRAENAANTKQLFPILKACARSTELRKTLASMM